MPLSNEQRQCRQSLRFQPVIRSFLLRARQPAEAFVSIREGVIPDKKIRLMRQRDFTGAILRLAEHGLLEIAVKCHQHVAPRLSNRGDD